MASQSRSLSRVALDHEGWRWRVIRTSNAYVFRDPKAAGSSAFPSKSENPAGTQDQDILDPVATPAGNLDSPLEHVLARFGAAVAAKNGLEHAPADPPVRRY